MSKLALAATAADENFLIYLWNSITDYKKP